MNITIDTKIQHTTNTIVFKTGFEIETISSLNNLIKHLD